MPDNAGPVSRLALPRLLAYAAPAVPLSMLGLPLNVYLPAFWSGSMGLALGTVGAVLTAVRLMDIVVDPAIGRFSDLLRWRFGRRKTPIAAGLPMGLLGGAMLFFPPPGSGAVWLFAAYALLTFAWSLIALPWQAWGAELSPNYTERTRITAWREGGTLLGVLISAVMPAALAITAPAAALHSVAFTALVLAAPAIAVLLAFVAEPPPGPPATAPLFASLRAAARNRPFRRLLLAWLINGIATGMPATLFLFMCTYVLDAPRAAGPVLLVYFGMAVLCMPVWAWLARRIGKHRAWAVAMSLMCVVFAPVFLLGPGDIGWFLAISVVSGATIGADFALPPAIQADVVDLDEAESGEKRAGLYFAAWTMAQKSGNALAAGIALGGLQWAGFHAAPGNGPRQLLALSALYCLAPLAMKLVAIALVWGFPIDARTQAALRARIAARAAAAAAAA